MRKRPDEMRGRRVSTAAPRSTVPFLAAALVASLLLGACSDEVEIRDARDVVINPGTWSVFDLRTGDCLDPDPEETGEVAEVPLVPCDDPHAQEVFATVEYPKGAYPGTDEVALWADGECLRSLEADFDLTLDDGLYISYLLPTFIGWNKDDDRRVVCVLVFPDREAATGSVVAGTADIDRAPPPLPPVPATTEEGAA